MATIIARHGTNAQFDTFCNDFLGSNTEDNASDSSYAETSHLGFWFNNGGNIDFYDYLMTCELNLENPYHIGSLELLAGWLNCQTAEELRGRLKDNDYDGIIVDNDEELGGTSYVVFSPVQIKIIK